MKYLMQLLIIALSGTNLISQDRPAAFVEDNRIVDATMYDNSTYYAMGANITQIDSTNSKIILHNSSLSYSEGRFYDESDGWVYLGWRYVDYDVILPYVLIHYWDGESLETKQISLLDMGYDMGAILCIV